MVAAGVYCQKYNTYRGNQTQKCFINLSKLLVSLDKLNESHSLHVKMLSGSLRISKKHICFWQNDSIYHFLKPPTLEYSVLYGLFILQWWPKYSKISYSAFEDNAATATRNCGIRIVYVVLLTKGE